MRKPRAPKVRAELHALISKLPRAGLGTAELVKKLKAGFPKLIADEQDEILELGLMRLAGDAFRRRFGATSSVQIEMFSEFAVPPTFTLRVVFKKGTKVIHKKLGDVTVADADAYVEQHTRPQSKNTDVAEVMRLLEYVKTHGAKDTDNLVRSWEEAKKSG